MYKVYSPSEMFKKYLFTLLIMAPGAVLAQNETAEKYMERRNWPEAYRVFTGRLEKNPGDTLALKGRALAGYYEALTDSAGYWRKAEADFLALEKRGNVKTALYLGALYTDRGRFYLYQKQDQKRARGYLDKALAYFARYEKRYGATTELKEQKAKAQAARGRLK